MVESNENFVIFLILFVLFFFLPKFLPHFGVKLLFMLLIAFQALSSIIKLHMSAFLGHLLTVITFTPSILLVSFFFLPHEYNKLKPQSRLCCFFGYGETQKGYRCYDPVSHRLRVSRNVVFWEHRSFVELSHFRSSLTTSFILEIFLDKSHIPSTNTLDPPLDFSIQLSDIFYASPE